MAARALALATITIGLAPSQAIRAVADNTWLPHWRLDAIDSLFGFGMLPSEGLQRLLSQEGVGHTPVDQFAIFVYLAWLPVCWAVMAVIIGIRWRHYRSFAYSWFGVWYLGLLGFVLFPTEPPWVLPEVQRTVIEGIAGFVDVDPNTAAAFPSLHVGMPATIAFQARALGMRTLSRPLFVFTGLTAFAVVHLGEHYVLDALAGVAVAWLTVRLAGRITKRVTGGVEIASDIKAEPATLAGAA